MVQNLHPIQQEDLQPLLDFVKKRAGVTTVTFNAEELVSRWTTIPQNHEKSEDQFKKIMLAIRDSFDYRIYTVYCIHFQEIWLEELRSNRALVTCKTVHLS